MAQNAKNDKAFSNKVALYKKTFNRDFKSVSI